MWIDGEDQRQVPREGRILFRRLDVRVVEWTEKRKLPPIAFEGFAGLCCQDHEQQWGSDSIFAVGGMGSGRERVPRRWQPRRLEVYRLKLSCEGLSCARPTPHNVQGLDGEFQCLRCVSSPWSKSSCSVSDTVIDISSHENDIEHLVEV